MPDKIEFPAAIVDETVYLIPSPAKLTISAINANLNPINLSKSNGTVIMFSSVDGKDIGEEALESIKKLVVAVRLNSDETILIKNQNGRSYDFNTLRSNFAFSKLICFGILPQNMGLHLKFRNHIYFKFNNLDMIMCDNIEGMEKTTRALLWNQLKMMYNI